MCYFVPQKTCCSLLLKKITCCAKREKKITCCEEKSQPPPPQISNGPSLNGHLEEIFWGYFLQLIHEYKLINYRESKTV